MKEWLKELSAVAGPAAVTLFVVAIFVLIIMGLTRRPQPSAQEERGPTVYRVRGTVEGGCVVYAVLPCTVCGWNDQRFFVKCPDSEPVALDLR